MQHHRSLILLTILSTALWTGCSGQSGGASGDQASGGTSEQREADTLPIPGQAAQLPPGHPPTTSSEHLGWTVPEGWVQKPVSSNMRYAEYAVNGPGGPGECVVYYFGPNQGGDAMANANRWACQFSQPDGSSSVDRMKVTRLDGASVPVTIVEVTGTYEGGMTMSSEPFEPRPGYMLLGGIAQGPDAPWFFKFTGPESTVRAQQPAFLDLMKSIETGD
jgi:hypothetical protein